MRKTVIILIALMLILLVSCGAEPEGAPDGQAGSDQTVQDQTADTADQANDQTADQADDTAEDQGNTDSDMTEEMMNITKVTYIMQMKIGDTQVYVDWEKNDSVDALAKLTAGHWYEMQFEMYGGFEQVGPIGQDLPRSDVQMETVPGDIVLYAGNQISVFYGNNSWSYTKLGHIRDLSQEELQELLGNGDTTISIYTEYTE